MPEKKYEALLKRHRCLKADLSKNAEQTASSWDTWRIQPNLQETQVIV